ncbi:hypothetical protein K466DRAFT_74694 [Polyporus arcularius HHB13444]|uniref:Uncharacterized protein n=1 Tax=Polyporus arcularius HHB13444 TaxID=1314778 RepID=A0A5C3PHN1_9APHY|nr:hypothetical protein K466DRAFT_74694 [Polyporus arcularius HHB13444]
MYQGPRCSIVMYRSLSYEALKSSSKYRSCSSSMTAPRPTPALTVQIHKSSLSTTGYYLASPAFPAQAKFTSAAPTLSSGSDPPRTHIAVPERRSKTRPSRWSRSIRIRPAAR